MNLTKLLWAFRAVVYKIRFKKIKMPSYVGKPVLIKNSQNISLGKRCRIYPGMRAELIDNNSFLTIGKNVSIGQNLHIVSYRDNLIIGDDVTISGNVMITNCDHEYEVIGQHILDQMLSKKKTVIGDGCFIGYGAVIQAGTILGKQCIVGANSVVRGEFPDYSVIVGVPGHIVKKYDIEKKAWRKV